MCSIKGNMCRIWIGRAFLVKEKFFIFVKRKRCSQKRYFFSFENWGKSVILIKVQCYELTSAWIWYPVGCKCNLRQFLKEKKRRFQSVDFKMKTCDSLKIILGFSPRVSFLMYILFLLLYFYYSECKFCKCWKQDFHAQSRLSVVWVFLLQHVMFCFQIVYNQCVIKFYECLELFPICTIVILWNKRSKIILFCLSKLWCCFIFIFSSRKRLNCLW